MPAIVNRASLGSAPPQRRVLVRAPRVQAPRAAFPLLSAQTKPAALSPEAAWKLPYISYERFMDKMMLLNPALLYRELPSGKVAVAVPKRANVAIEAYEALTWIEKRQVDVMQSDDGPSLSWVSVSKGHISPFVTLITERLPGTVQQVIARSLKSILSRLVSAGGFTWEEAEIAFGMNFRAYLDKVVEVADVVPRVWAEGHNPGPIVLTGGS